MSQSTNTNLDLTNDELLVLFEWAHRFCETERLAFSHHAEVVVIDKIASQLERTLVEPFDASYSRLLMEARQRVLASYEEKMGSKAWIHDQPLNQS
jgi:hypothetical protein